MRRCEVKAALYLRVSTRDQVNGRGHGEKVSLDEQRAAALRVCAENGWEAGPEYREEGASASRADFANRPQMQRLIADAAAGGFQAVAAFADTRFDRNTKGGIRLILALSDAGIRYLAVPGTLYDLEEPWSILRKVFASTTSEADAKNRAAAIKSGKQGLRSRGMWPEARCPFGYRWQKAPRGVSGEGKPVLDKREAAAVKLIYRLAEQGNRPQEIADELTRRGVLTRSQEQYRQYAEDPERTPMPTRHDELYAGSPWDPGVIVRMVKRREYLGEWRPDGQTLWADAPPPLIGKPQWARAQRAVERRVERRARKHVRQFLLQGYLVCDICGKRMTVAQPFNERSWRYYRCSKRCRPNIRAERIEEKAWAAVAEVLRKPDQIREGAEKYREHGIEAWREERGTIELAVIGCDATIEKAEQGYLDGVFTAERAKIIQDQQAKKKADLEKQIAALTEQIERGERREARLLATEDLARRLKDPDRMSFEEKRWALEGLGVDKIVVPEDPEKSVISLLGAPLAAIRPELKGGSR